MLWHAVHQLHYPTACQGHAAGQPVVHTRPALLLGTARWSAAEGSTCSTTTPLRCQLWDHSCAAQPTTLPPLPRPLLLLLLLLHVTACCPVPAQHSLTTQHTQQRGAGVAPPPPHCHTTWPTTTTTATAYVAPQHGTQAPHGAAWAPTPPHHITPHVHQHTHTGRGEDPW